MLDKTIRPSFSNLETVGPRDELFNRALSLPVNDRLTPSFFIFENEQVKKIQIEADQTVFRIGTAETNEVVIKDPSVADIQVTVIRSGMECYFMDCGGNDIVQFNGVKKRQEIIEAESRMVLRIGMTWVIYIGIDFHKYDETDSILLKRSLIKSALKKSYGEVLLKLNDYEWSSRSAPILAGSHNSCDFRIDVPGVEPFHFLVYYSPTGLFVEDITKGRPGILVNGVQCKMPIALKEDTCIQVNNLNVYLYVYGNLDDQCEFIFKDLTRKPGLKLLSLRDANAFVDLPLISRKLTIGRSDECDIILDDQASSRIHAHFMVRDKYLMMQDNNSRNKTYVNLKPISKAHVIPGDIIEIGDTCFLLCYQ